MKFPTSCLFPVCAVLSHSVLSDSLWPHRLQPTGCSVHGILQARILEWAAMPSSRGSSLPRDQTQVSHVVGGFFTIWATREAHEYLGSFTGFSQPRNWTWVSASLQVLYQLSYQRSPCHSPWGCRRVRKDWATEYARTHRWEAQWRGSQEKVREGPKCRSCYACGGGVHQPPSMSPAEFMHRCRRVQELPFSLASHCFPEPSSPPSAPVQAFLPLSSTTESSTI